MKSLRVIAARYDEALDHIQVVNEIVNDDDTVELGLHTFPPEVLEWRAALYGTTDLDELIDFVIFEPHTEDVRPLELSVEVARQRHRERIAEAKSRLRNRSRVASRSVAAKSLMASKGVDRKYIDAADDDPYEVIKRHCPFDEEVLQVKSEYVATQRSTMQLEKAKRNKRPTGAERAQELRKKLFERGESGVNAKAARPAARAAQVVETKSGELPPIVMERK